jgi:two-component system OmpR family response regulator
MSAEQPKILVVDDDEELQELIAETLSEFGFASRSAYNGTEMFEVLEHEAFDMILLDIMMPGEDGLALCRLLRAPGNPHSTIPIIFLTALKDTVDKVIGLEIGGDDYLSKPFQSRELIARIKALLRRSSYSDDRLLEPPAIKKPIKVDEEKANTLLIFGNWKLNIMTRHLIDEDGITVPLSAAEFRLLALFLENPQQVVTRDKIMDYLAERSLNIYDRSIDSQVSRLRAKLRDKGANPSLIRTMRGDGYMFATPVERSAP